MKSLLFKNNLYLFFILLTGLFLRIYKLGYLFPYATDGDLYSWIVKDILVDHHLRLIGQMTSIPGIFIGPLFYYLLTPFFALFRMNPEGVMVLSAISGILTIISIYFVISKFFGKNAGLIGSLIYAVSVNLVIFDRWVVPTMFVPLWSIWYLYILFCIEKGEYKKIWILGVLIGLIWHIHIALLPLLILIPVCIFISKKPPKITQLILPALIVVSLLSPFLIFEIRHNFQQILAALSLSKLDTAQAESFFRLVIIIYTSAKEIAQSLFYLWPLPPSLIYPILIAGIIFLRRSKILSRFQLICISLWYILIIIAQEISNQGISEYYFASFIIPSILCLALFIFFLMKKFQKIKLADILIFSYFIYNIYNFINIPLPGEGFAEKNKVVEFIVNDAISKNYSCIQLNFITDRGNDGGFRYLFWLKSLTLIKPGQGAPVYSIVLPWNYSPEESNPVYGKIGIIVPKTKEFINEKVCNDPNNQLETLLGFSN